MDLITTLSETLEDKLGLQRAATIDDLFSSAPDGPPLRAFFMSGTSGDGGPADPVEIILDEHFQLDADAIIRDELLGSLGFVHVLADSQTLEQEVSRRLDKAIFFRHLLLENAREQVPEVSPYFVEVVFLVPVTGAPKTRDAFSSALRQMVERSTVVNAIGVNLWHGTAETLTSETTLRRAFSWLLRDVQKWLTQPPQFASGINGTQPSRAGKQSTLAIVKTENFRVAGTRVLELPPQRQLHVLHGYNGSGKTAIAEALEFALTGTVDRIPKSTTGDAGANQALLVQALRHHGLTDNEARARVTLKFRNGTGEPSEETTVEVGGLGPTSSPLLRLHSGNAFRLNQTFADQLMFLGPEVAARAILEAFFPNEQKSLQQARTAREEARAAVAALPERLRERFTDSAGKLDVEKTTKELAWLEQSEISWENLRALLPLSPEQAQTLASISAPTFIHAYMATASLRSDLMEAHLKSLDEGFVDLVVRATQLKSLAIKALEQLEALRNLSVEKARDHRPLEQLLRDWMEKIAHCDLIEREHALLKTIEQLSTEFERLSRELPVLARVSGKAAVLPARRETLLNRFRKERDAARAAWQARQTTTAPSQQDGGSAPRAVEHGFGVLDEAAQAGLFGIPFVHSDLSLSEAVRQVQQSGDVVDLTTSGQTMARVGSTGWSEALQDKLRPIIAALEAFTFHLGEPVLPPSEFLKVVEKTAAAAKALGAADVKLIDKVNELFAANGRLLPPLNELIALLTPQRWSYEDLGAENREDAAGQSFDPQTGGTSARLILNTAEQNAFALALFLLCARLQPNALKLIVLDDPFQNMDEFTVTGVARGLTRLLRLWAQHDASESRWQLLILIHSIENLDRLRSETPCSIMALPWLKPIGSESKDDPDLFTEPISGPEKRQSLAGVIRGTDKR